MPTNWGREGEEVGNKYTNPKMHMNQIQRPLPLTVSKSVQRDHNEKYEDITTSGIQVATINTFSQERDFLTRAFSNCSF